MIEHNGITRAIACVAITATLVGSVTTPTAAGVPLVVHEWGTFTTLQDEQGQEVPGINVDDEPVPPFVHGIASDVLSPALLTSPYWTGRKKGAPRHHPLVTMRLETPVIYFYPASETQVPLHLDVSVRFRGGWLTEFYPFAEVDSPGADKFVEGFRFEALNATTIGQLTWRDLRVGTGIAGPETDWPVWNAPRKVAATSLTTAGGESEKYLFYRGVARQRSPLRATMNRPRHELQLRGSMAEVLSSEQVERIRTLWLAHVLHDGRMAFRAIGPVELTASEQTVVAQASTAFRPEDYSHDNVERLKSQMHAAIQADGLFADEATALLETWRRAYFTSHGLRLFYLVPRPWTDFQLPLTLSAKAEIQRVMVGRIELISDEQHNLIDKLATTPVSSSRWADRLPDGPAREKFFAGRRDFGDLGVPIPEDYQIYLDLGRFRNALLSAAERGSKHPNLTKFIDTYGLQPYRW